MDKQFISDMSSEDLKKVFNANKKLKNDVIDDMIETEMYYIGEQLDILKPSLSDWSIGVYKRNYITIKDSCEFVLLLSDVENSIPVLINTDIPLLERALNIREDYRNAEMYSDEYDTLSERLDHIARELRDIVLKRFNNSLEGCYNEEYQLEYFISFYSDSRLDNRCYIDSDDYTLKEDVVKFYN